MTKPVLTSLALVTGLLLSGCASLAPAVPAAQPQLATDWPIPATTDDGDTAVADIGWRDFFTDARLERLIEQALTNNRDLRVALLNVEKARAQYRIQRADRLPSVAANGGLERGRLTPTNGVTDQYSASLGIAEFELDLFGRVRNLSEAALNQYLAREEARRAAQLSLVAEVANAYLTLAADRRLAQLAEDTFHNRQRALALSERRHQLGAVSGLDLSQARASMETARTDLARYRGQVARDINALTLLVGAPIAPELLPDEVAFEVSGLQPLPAGLPSEVLLRRPDVQQAEYALQAASANIGAARAAFFPSIRLTGSIGTASGELDGLFDGGTRIWSFMPRLNLPIFQGGSLRAALGMAQAERDIALANYENAIQSGFREVADALVLTGSLAEQQASQQALVAAAGRAEQLSRARYDAGRDSYLVLLDAERTLYNAEQALINTQLTEQSNRVNLYKALGGGWQQVE
ncbi:multidrug efflux system outer membrane protein [Oceanisphaera litoralis]|uniref:efflux transporter outer membrane subunit n=1 Tax=Oceanisphaera litoralis TaxID=225144 RepID=UPI00195A43D4|nr:efflux transporter outer membrane subunit [Oceanisphaera litoralis]MBM7454793.1 multidrug efflux system outer membrane protein [Oceanisphaera litoralis]